MFKGTPKNEFSEQYGINAITGKNLNNTGQEFMYTGTSALDGSPIESKDLSVFAPGGVSSASAIAPNTDKGLFDGFNYGGTKGSTGLGGAIGAGLGIGQLGLGVMQYLDAEKTNKLNRELMNQQIVSNKDTMATRLARRAQIQKDWGSQNYVGAAAPKVG